MELPDIILTGVIICLAGMVQSVVGFVILLVVGVSAVVPAFLAQLN